MDDHELETAEMPAEWYAGSQGYDPEFLGKCVDLPILTEAQCQDVAPLKDGTGYELKYTHFSVVLSKQRQLALFTAVNIDGAHMQSLPRKGDKWYFDPRVEQDYQMGPPVYKHPDLDRGHLVRRLDPVWGDQAKVANEDTFHFTNCSPQHKHLNQKTWLSLEDYIKDNAENFQARLAVFTGPVFRDDDVLYLDKYRIPAEFWKVVAFVKQDGELSATAYMQTQRDLIDNLEAAPFEEFNTYQVAVSKIEELTGLSFGELHLHDPLQPGGLESEWTPQLVTGPESMIL